MVLCGSGVVLGCSLWFCGGSGVVLVGFGVILGGSRPGMGNI